MTVDRFNAVYTLVGGAITQKADGEIDYHDGQTPPTDEAIQAKLVELQADYDSKQYQRDRKQEYPSLQECIHAILDDDLEALQAKRTAVKTKYPKPE